jgi:hypothetical protein
MKVNRLTRKIIPERMTNYNLFFYETSNILLYVVEIICGGCSSSAIYMSIDKSGLSELTRDEMRRLNTGRRSTVIGHRHGRSNEVVDDSLPSEVRYSDAPIP